MIVNLHVFTELDLKKVIVNMDRAESLFNEEFEKSQKTISMLFDNLRTMYVVVLSLYLMWINLVIKIS